MPHVIVIAGPNAAGKSTAAPARLHGLLGIEHFVNADVIARGLSAFDPESVSIQVGRIMLERLHDLASRREDFAFETTLASRGFAPWIAGLRRDARYRYLLFYLWVPAPEVRVARVDQRVAEGGHFVPPEIVARRYIGGLRNFFELYRPIADEWRIYSNADPRQRYIVADGIRGDLLTVYDKDVWETILRQVKNDQARAEIDAALADGKAIDDVMQEVGRQEMLRRKALGLSVVVWRDGKVVTIPAAEIPDDGVFA